MPGGDDWEEFGMPEGSAFRSCPARGVVAAAAIFATLTLHVAATAQEAASPIGTPPTWGGGHFTAPDPAILTPEQATEIYRDIKDQMVSGYRLSGNAAARNFTRWQRFNSAPYRSANHGQRFVNNYANATAEAYGRYEEAGVMPPGAVIVKDTFYVSQSGGAFPGALMIMEKMEAGFDDATGDWRYTMIMPDGSLFGTTGGENAQSVEFCGTCHALAAANDHLYFLPKAFRIRAD